MEELKLLVMVHPDMEVVRFGTSSSIDHNNNGGQVSIAVPATARLSHKLENQSLIRRCLSITSGLKNSEVANPLIRLATADNTHVSVTRYDVYFVAKCVVPKLAIPVSKMEDLFHEYLLGYLSIFR
jgi:hypothetical protein